MASIWKHPKSPYWTACFNDANGNRRKRSTKELDRRKALKIAEALEQASRQRVTEAQARRVLSDIYQTIHGEPLPSSSLENYFAQWVERKRVETAPATAAKYAAVAQEFLAFLGQKRGQDLNQVSVSDITRFRDAAAKKSSAATANAKLKVLRVIFRSAWREGLINDIPAGKVSTIKRRDMTISRRAFTLHEVKLLFENANNEWKGLILFGIYTGQRLSDIANLTWQNIDIQRRELRLVTQKTGRQQIIPIAGPLLKWLESQQTGDDPRQPLFPSSNNLRSGYLSGQFYDLMASVGLVPPRPRTHKGMGKGRTTKRSLTAISFHCLRHTATSLLKNAGVGEAVAMDIIGHESKAISSHYTHVDEAAKRDALNRLPDITTGQTNRKE